MFIRYISHEIRNPLNNVMLGLDHLEEVMCRESGCSPKVETVREMRESCRVSLGILNDMLTSDKIRSAFLVLEIRHSELRDVLYGTTESLRTQVLASHDVTVFNCERKLFCDR